MRVCMHARICLLIGYLLHVSHVEIYPDFCSVQSLSRVWLFAIPWTAACQASLSIINSRSLLKPHAHQAGDAIQPSHPLLSPYPPAFNLSQHWGLFKWVSSSHQEAKILEFQLQHQSFQWIFRTDWSPLGWTGWISLQSTGLSRVSPISQFKSINSSALSFLYSPTLTSIHDPWKNHSLD